MRRAIMDIHNGLPVQVTREDSDLWTGLNARYAAYRGKHASLGHHITFNYSLSSPVPMHEGRTLGYFDDSATHTLLGLEDDDQVS